MAFCEVFALILYKSWGLLWCEGIIKSALQTDLVAVVRVVTHDVSDGCGDGGSSSKFPVT